MVGSQPKRGALRRQACIDQHQDPWVRHSDSSPGELAEARHRPVGSPLPENVCRNPPIMTERETLPALNDTVETSEPSSDVTPPEIPLVEKKGPPVAPKPPWFRQSLRKILDEQNKKNPEKPTEQRGHKGFSRSFCGRSSSSAANLSIKQKIHSFETFSSPAGSEKVENRKPSFVSSACHPLVKESRSPSGSLENGKDEVPEETQANPSPTVSTSPPTSEGPPHLSSTPEEQHVSNQEPRDLEVADMDSGSNDALSSLDHNERNTSPSEEESRTQRSAVLTPTACPRLSDGKAECPRVDVETNEHLTVNQPHKDLDGENLVKILTFGNQVTNH